MEQIKYERTISIIFLIFLTIGSMFSQNVDLGLSDYRYTKTKAWGDGILAFASFADGFLEGYQFDGRKSVERMFGVDPISYAGSESWRKAYKGNDPTNGFRNKWVENVGVFDLYHNLDDTRKIGYISAGVCIGIGFKSNKNWKHYAVDIAKSLAISAIFKRAGMKLARGQKFL